MAEARKIALLLLLAVSISFCLSQRNEVKSFLNGKRVTRSVDSSSSSSSSSEEDEEYGDGYNRYRRSPVRRTKPLKRNKLRNDAPCESEARNTGEAEPWSLDTGVVPDGLEGGANDGLEGIGGSAPASDIPWSDVFNANPKENGDNPTPDSGNGDAWPPPEPTEQPSDWNSDSGDNWGESTSENPWGTSESDSGWGNSDTDDNWRGTSSAPPVDEGEPDCTCMSIMACGGTFRSGDVGPDICAEGEVCCPIEKTGLPEGTTENPPPSCGIGHPNKSVTARLKLETTSLFGELPWTVMLLSEQNGEEVMFCAGSIIHLQVVLTSAHCLERFKAKPEKVIVRGGEWDIMAWGLEPFPYQDRSIQSITFHPSYRTGHPIYDLALIFLTDPFTYAENINTVCLPSDFGNVDKTRCIASGWGKDPTAPPQVGLMKKIVLPIVPNKDCQDALRKTRLGKYFKLHSSFICAGSDGKDVCLGDGGGPLVCPMANADGTDTMVQMGVTSWGIDCHKPGIPGVYADVSSEQQWIKDTIALFF